MKVSEVAVRIQCLLQQAPVRSGNGSDTSDGWDQVDALLGNFMEFLLRGTDITARAAGVQAAHPDDILRPFRENERQWLRLLRLLDRTVPAPFVWSKHYRPAFRDLLGGFYSPRFMAQAFPGWKAPAIPLKDAAGAQGAR